MALLSLAQFYSAVVFWHERVFRGEHPDLLAIAIGHRQHRDTFPERSGGIRRPPVLTPRGRPRGESESVNERGVVLEMCQQTLVNESNAVYKHHQQKLHKPQWQVRAHQVVYRVKECFLRDVSRGLMEFDWLFYLFVCSSLLIPNPGQSSFIKTHHFSSIFLRPQDVAPSLRFSLVFFRKSCVYSLISMVQSAGFECLSAHSSTNGFARQEMSAAVDSWDRILPTSVASAVHICFGFFFLFIYVSISFLMFCLKFQGLIRYLA